MNKKKYQRVLKASVFFTTLSVALSGYTATDNPTLDRFVGALRTRVLIPGDLGLLDHMRYRESVDVNVGTASHIGRRVYEETGNLNQSLAQGLLSLVTPEENLWNRMWRKFYPLPSEEEVIGYTLTHITPLTRGIIEGSTVGRIFLPFLGALTAAGFEGLFAHVVEDLTR